MDLFLSEAYVKAVYWGSTHYIDLVNPSSALRIILGLLECYRPGLGLTVDLDPSDSFCCQ